MPNGACSRVGSAPLRLRAPVTCPPSLALPQPHGHPALRQDCWAVQRHRIRRRRTAPRKAARARRRGHQARASRTHSPQ
ncbi:hypothetical protein ACFPRL_25675 [Pseudoclavibacter helvolus]